MKDKPSYWINRFPVCALTYAVAAEKLGYDKDEAESMGLTRSIFFAAAKFGKFRGQRVDVRKKIVASDASKRMDKDSDDMINFAGLGLYCVTVKGHFRGIMGGKIIEPEQFSRDVYGKMVNKAGQEAYDKTRAYIGAQLDKLNKDELNSAAVYKVYESLRDVVREVAFLSDFPKVKAQKRKTARKTHKRTKVTA